MKKIILLMMLPFYALVAMAQDMLVTNEGKSLTIYNLEISDQSIFFQLSDKADAPLQKMLKKDVLIIKKADGTKLDLNAPNSIKEKVQATKEEANKDIVSTPIIVKNEDLNEELKEQNQLIKDCHNNDFQVIVEDKYRKEEAKEAWVRFGIKEESVLIDENIFINIQMGALRKENKNDTPSFIKAGAPLYDPSISAEITNKSDKTIYIDLGNSFYIEMGSSTSYYKPTSTTTTTSSSKGGSINLGSVANALGINGVAGTLAGGVNVGGGSTSGTTNTTYSQRVIAIPPKSSFYLDAKYLFNQKSRVYQGLYYRSLSGYSYIQIFEFSFPKKQKNGALMSGERITFQENNSPLNFSIVLSYSDNEKCENLKTLSTHLYLKDIVGMNCSWTGTERVLLKGEFCVAGMKAYLNDYGKSTYFPKK